MRKAFSTRSASAVPSYVEEVGWLSSRQFDDVHRSHGQTGAIDHTTHITVQVDVIEAIAFRFHLGGVFLVGIALVGQLWMSEKGIIVQRYFAVDRHDPVVCRVQTRIDLKQRSIRTHESRVELGNELAHIFKSGTAQAQVKTPPCEPGNSASPKWGRCILCVPTPGFLPPPPRCPFLPGCCK